MQENYSLLKHNTFGINVNTRWFLDYSSKDELKEALAFYNTLPQGTPLLHIGGGSNLLFLSDYAGVVLHCSNKVIETLADDVSGVLLRVGAGMVWDDLVAYAIEHDLHGLENLSLIPGEVGASAVQNIGAYGAEAKDLIHEVECVNLHTGETRIFANTECQYSYRHSIFKTDAERNKWAVVSVTYRLSHTFTPNLDYGGIRSELERRGIDAVQLSAAQLREVIIDIRKYKLPDPKVQGNAGSFFMNPIVSREKYESLAAQYPNMPHYVIDEDHVKIPAGWMIEQCGWKGRGIGHAAVHDRQALVLVNKGGATSDEIVNLCDTVRADVSSKFGIDIRPEVIFI